ncbi:MAG: LacI family DNA-binding transcriptional regulator [Hespellia sp.]|nr:LacI family DNA-binding transcriptional regulator [Hespellia sp.]
MPTTIRDISKETGLSLATISKYLNGGNVLPENREKIAMAVEKLHYEVNEIARSLVTKKTRTIGVVVYSVECAFNGSFIHYVNNILSEKGYGLLICDSSNDEKKEAANIKFLLNKKVDGMIVTPVSNNTEFLKPAKTAEVPVVLVDRALKSSEFDCVKIDNRTTAMDAVNLLIKNNHQKIAIICSAKEYTGIERYKGYRDAMSQAGLSVPASYQKKGIHAMEYGYESMKQLLKLKDRPTAVFMTNYELTLGAVMAVNESSEVNCPEHISMLGFDDLILAHVIQPRMYMVVQPVKEMGEKAVEQVLRRIAGNDDVSCEINMNAHLKRGNSIKMLA